MKTMKTSILSLLVLAPFAAQAAVQPRTAHIVIESPDTRPVLAEAHPEAMYLYDTSDGKTVLYVEAENGHVLDALDVTDPGHIRRLAQTEVAAAGAYDFVAPAGSQAVLVRYRDGSGTALLQLKRYTNPTLEPLPDAGSYTKAEPFGESGLLLFSPDRSTGDAGRRFSQAHTCKVVDTRGPLQSVLLATVPDVRQRVLKSDTGTLFLLTGEGVTVIRRPRVEEEHQIAAEAQ
ncbi:hypothetical protein [Pseudacidobacterium ailaaui]|jgi:hypothetical protein|uniref:hypothetical protein n=1 Tax=Pseudacidobacterium ailaaui TaxID=1382359 RepID=UPI000478AB76|nr:hypothetical protein [Pseudacidobacterium ailaaui]MBX6359324.1 hypothetical protein [Pseudacidobacterium ailaaui]MCL6462983.1 hypothetical protein [Pseudacidobacterium ailaaui]